MAQLLLIKKGQYSFDENMTRISEKFQVLDFSNLRTRYQFGHTCLDITVPNKLERKDVLAIREMLAPHQIDVLWIESYVDKTRPNIFCFDMDSTVIREEVIDELARKHNVFDEVSRVTKEAMEGGIEFDQALRLRVKYLKGLSRKSFEEVYHLLQLNPGMDVLLRELPFHKTLITILSGGFTPVLELFASKYPIHFFKANALEEENGNFTGEIVGEIINKEKKAFYLSKLREEKMIPSTQVVAIGDGANDSLMLQTASIGIGFHAKQGLKDQIVNWIEFSDLSILIFLFRPSI